MRPIKRKQISEKVAERLNLSAETVDEIVSCYYTSIQKQLSGMMDPHVNLERLGTFYIKRSKLEKKLAVYKAALEKYEKIPEPTMSEYKSIKAMKADIVLYENMLEKLKELDKKKLAKEEEKKTYKNKKL